MTGATGFLGTALVERLLRSVPGCEIVVLVRPGQRQGPAERTRREVLRNDCFDRLRAELGESFEDVVARRLHTIAGDVTRDGLGWTRQVVSSLGLLRHRDPCSSSGDLRCALGRRRGGEPPRPGRVAETLGELRP